MTGRAYGHSVSAVFRFSNMRQVGNVHNVSEHDYYMNCSFFQSRSMPESLKGIF